MQQSKIDAVINKLIDDIHGRGNGFVLDLAKGQDGQQKILVQEALKPVDEYMPPAKGRQHTIGDTASFMTYAARYGDKAQSLVIYSDERCVLVLDESLEDGDREFATMPFARSPEFLAWARMFGASINHKALLKHLLLNTHTLVQPEVLESMRSVNINATIDNKSDIQEDAKSIGVLIKTTKGDQLKKFPKSFDVRLPVLEPDATDEEAWRTVTVRLQVELPDDPTKGVSFLLYCTEWPMQVRERVAEEMELVRDALKDWTVVRGWAGYFQRVIGRNGKHAQPF
jgi:hypothetical protein